MSEQHRSFAERRSSALLPGGWLELADYVLPCRSNDGTYEGTSLQLWCDTMIQGANVLNRPVDCALGYRKWIEEAGFTNIEERMFAWPTNTWPKNRKLKELGRWNEVSVSEGLEGFSYALMCRGLNWTKEEVDVLAAKTRNDLHDKTIHAYFQM